MGLNIVATRKYSLKGFAQGWDDAFVIVSAATESQRKAYADSLLGMRGEMQEAIAEGDEARIKRLEVEIDDRADGRVRAFALELIQGGKVVSTSEDGATQLVSFDKEDAPTVLEALGFAWVKDIVEVATGADRLKAKN